MSVTRWIIENFTDSEDYRSLIEEIKKCGRNCFVIGKHNHFDFDASQFQEKECIVVQGSIQMTRHIAAKLPPGCYPIAYNSWDNFLCSAYYPRLEKFLFNDKYSLVTFGELKKNTVGFFEQFGRQETVFIRPDSGEKSFAGQIVELGQFEQFCNNHVVNNAQDSDLIVVSTPKIIKGEWRFLCTKYQGGEIVASSGYRQLGRKAWLQDAPQKAVELCRELLDEKYFPDSVFCVDICQDADGDFWLLELTAFSSAGLYAMDKAKVAVRVSEIAEDEYKQKYG
jgi:hypothetical protein